MSAGGSGQFLYPGAPLQGCGSRGRRRVSSGRGLREGCELAPAPKAGCAGVLGAAGTGEPVWTEWRAAEAGMWVDTGKEAGEASQERNSRSLRGSEPSFSIDFTKENG